MYESMYIVELQELLIDGETIKTINGESILDSGDLELATKEEVNAKADDSTVVHTTGDETIDGVKTFRYSIKAPGGIALGPGAAITSYNNVNNNTVDMLSYQHGAFVVNSPEYPLYFNGQSERAKYNNAEMAMLSDVENKQDVISDLDSIRSGASKGATALQSVPSEYITETELNNKGYATTSALNDKVDKVSGKGLSTEDFTTALKNKLEGLANYDDTALSNAISSLQTQFDTLVSGDPSDAINSFNEIIAFLDGVKDTQDLASIIAGIEQQIATKQDKITDLETIRSGAAKGATALQSYTEKYTGTITGIKMNGASKGTSGVVDLGTVITAHQDISGKADKSSLATVATSGSYNDLSNKPTIPAAVTESTVSGWGFTKNTGTYSKPSGGIPKTDLASTIQTSLGKADTALQSYTEQYQGTVQSVATSETLDEVNTTTYVKYVSQTLTDAQKAQARSNIGAAAIGEGGGGSTLTESDIAAMGFTKNTGTYSKPSGGIPKTDLASSVQTSLGKADTALQSYTEQYKGTVTGVKINGTTKNPSSGVVDLGTVITSHQDISGKQDKLTSGTNIKTVNNTSLLGSGNVSVGTITAIQANGTSVATSGTANIPAASTSAYGVTKLSSSTSSTSTTLAATSSAVKAAYDLANGKQDKLTSGTNIKTINGTSILGSGDITISSEGNYLPSSGGIITGDLVVNGTIASPTLIMANGGINGYLRSGDCILGIRNNNNIVWGEEGFGEYYITAEGDGTKFLSDDGTYKAVSGGSGESDAGNYPLITTYRSTIELQPNTYTRCPQGDASVLEYLVINFKSPIDGVINEYVLEYNLIDSLELGYSVPLEIGGHVIWENDNIIDFVGGYTYIISFLYNEVKDVYYAAWQKF